MRLTVLQYSYSNLRVERVSALRMGNLALISVVGEGGWFSLPTVGFGWFSWAAVVC